MQGVRYNLVLKVTAATTTTGTGTTTITTTITTTTTTTTTTIGSTTNGTAIAGYESLPWGASHRRVTQRVTRGEFDEQRVARAWEFERAGRK